jgi:hypothetical protein
VCEVKRHVPEITLYGRGTDVLVVLRAESRKAGPGNKLAKRKR